MGYILYRRIIGYYSFINEDGFDMRKSTKWDKDKVFMHPVKLCVNASDVDSEDEEEDDDDNDNKQ